MIDMERKVKAIMLIADLREGSYHDSHELKAMLVEQIGALEDKDIRHILRSAVGSGVIVPSPTKRVVKVPGFDRTVLADGTISITKRKWTRKINVYKRTDVALRLPARIMDELHKDDETRQCAP